MIVVKLSKQLNIANRCGIKIGGVNKLVPNLGNKSKYVLHYKNLYLYLLLRMSLVKVHRILKFNQSHWLINTLIYNTDKRKSTANSFEKDFLKHINNSVYGKTILDWLIMLQIIKNM